MGLKSPLGGFTVPFAGDQVGHQMSEMRQVAVALIQEGLQVSPILETHEAQSALPVAFAPLAD